MGFLSSLFGSSRPQPATQQVVTSQQLPSEIAPAVKKVVDEAELIYDAEKAAGYIPFEGATIAPLTPEEEAAQAGIAGLVGTQKPFLDEALGIIRQQSQAFTPEVAQQFMSPYQRAVTDIEKRESQRDFERNIQPALEAKAIQQGGGMSGLGTRAALEAAEAQRNQSRLLADIESRGLQSAFEDAQSAFEKQKAREANTASAIGKVGAETFKSGLAEQGALQTIGEQKRDLAQSALDEEYFKFLEEREFPQQKLAEYSGFVYGNPLTRLSSSTQNQTSNPFQPSFGQQLLGIGSTLGSSFLGSKTGANRFADAIGLKGGGGLSDIIKRKGGGRFPDMSGDGKVTQKDILMGRGVIARQVGGDLDVDEAEPTSLEALEERSPMEAELARLQAARTSAPNVSGLRKFGIRPEGYYTQAAKEDAEARRKLLQPNIPFAAQAASDFLAALGKAAVREEGNVGAAFADKTAKSAKERKDRANALKALELQEIEKSRAAEDKEYGRSAALAEAALKLQERKAKIIKDLRGTKKRGKFSPLTEDKAEDSFDSIINIPGVFNPDASVNEKIREFVKELPSKEKSRVALDVQEMLRADSELDLDEAVQAAIRNAKARGKFKKADKIFGLETLGRLIP